MQHKFRVVAGGPAPGASAKRASAMMSDGRMRTRLCRDASQRARLEDSQSGLALMQAGLLAISGPYIVILYSKYGDA